jgi:hypothetical protein
MPLSSSAQYNLQQQQQQGQPQSAQPGQPQQPPEPQNAQEWDYKNNPVNPKGETLPAGAKSWTPLGTPYFGAGIGGTLKRYAWMFMGSPTGQDDSRWEKFQELTQTPQFWNDPTSKEFKEGVSQFKAGVYGEKDPEASARMKQIMAEYRTPNGVNISAMPDEVRNEYEKLQNTYGGGSLLSPIVKGSKVAVQAVLDVLSEASVKAEQMQGVTSAMRDYAQENSSLPAFGANIDRTQGSPSEQEGFWSDPAVMLKSESAQEVGNITSRLLLPFLNGWDAMRFWTAPGTLKQKQQVLETGWDAGRILYSQAIKPSLLAEFKRRAAAGEDPQLLAQELQNPWAEGIGQAILDPLNVVGMVTKGAKIAGMLDKATDAVKGGSLGDEAAEILKNVDAIGETRAAGQLDKFDDILTKNIDRIESQRLTVDFNKAGSYSPSGLRVREAKAVQSVSTIATHSIMRGGGTADDVADFFHNIAKATSADKARRLEAWDEIFSMSKRFGLGRYAFSDDVLESGILLRNLSEDKDLLTALKAGKGDLAATAEILNKKFKAAIDKQVLNYSEVKTLAEKFRKGEDVSKAAEKAAKTFEGIKGRNKALWNLHEGTVGKARNAINSTLGKFYFSQPGFAVRNMQGNFVTMFVDSGFGGTAKSYYRDGKFWSIGAIEEDLGKWFGGKLPPGAGGMTMIESEQALTGVSKFNDNIEKGFAKRIYWKNFRDTMDKFMTPGVALPKREEFKALGMSDEAIDHFVHIVKHESYGNVEQAIVKYSEKYDDAGLLDTWKRWNGSVSADEMKGLDEAGLTREIEDIVSTATSPQQIKEKITALKRELMNRANSATDNMPGVNREREGFEFVEGLGKATDEGLMDVDGTNKLNILIEQSEKATEELTTAIGKARDKYNQLVGAKLAPPFDFSVMEQAFSATRRGAARRVSQELTDTAWALTKKSKTTTGIGASRLWDESILAKRGPAPAGLTPEQFRTELWQATRDSVSNNWEMYFAEGFDKLTPVIDNLSEQFPDLAPIFAKSQKSSAELNMYRTAVYRDGKIFYAQPPKNIRELASRYGIATKAEDVAQNGVVIGNGGANKDKQLLATINKYADQKYKTLDEVPLEEAEKALEARRAGAMSTADAARVEQPKTLAGNGESVATGEAVQASPTEIDTSAVDDLGEGAIEAYKRLKGINQTNVKDLDAIRLDYRKSAREAEREIAELEKELAKLPEAPKVTGKKKSGKQTNAEWSGELFDYNGQQMTRAEIITDLKKSGGTPAMVDRYMQGLEGAKKRATSVDYMLRTSLQQQQERLDSLRSLETMVERYTKEVKGGAVKTVTEAAQATPVQVAPTQATDELGAITDPTPNPEVQISPPYVDGSTPIPGQMWKENSDGILAALNKVETHMLENYGTKAAEKLDGNAIKALKGLMKDSNGKITEGMAIADKIGKEWRDFTLLPYGETKNFDLALSYAFPYQFWYSRSYSNWMKRVATDPQVIANYARIKENMAKINKDSPEWWRYNVEIPSHFLGLPNEHPMSFNLEANIWPLYGLTGTDFTDPQKRQNWMTSTVDDMGKMGPSVWSPIQWAMALYYKSQGEDELAQAWGGRIIPQTATFKAISPYIFGGKVIETDPGVQLFSGKGIMDFDAMDKYERNRVGRALTAMVQSGEVTEEQAVEIARTQEGPVWDEAIKRATQIRAPGQISSFLFGVGMKARTEEDRISDEFYEKYYRLQNLNEADLISPEQYQKEWDGLRDAYPFMDALLLSKKAGPDRDRAYAYNVLGRIPPGQSSELYKAVGIDPTIAQKFYDSKGNIKDWSQSDRDKFLASMVDLGAMLSIPDYTTKQDWNEARANYKGVQEGMKQNFGPDIADKIDELFSMEDKDARDAYMQRHPEVGEALQWQNEQVVNNESLYTYYGGIQALEKYHKGKVYDTLEAKYGSDIQEKFSEYYDMQISDPAGAKSYYRLHPELAKYNKEKKVLMEQALRAIVDFGSRLPDTPKPELTGNTPQSVGQQNIEEYATQQTPDFSFWQAEMPEVSNILANYWSGNEPIPYAVTKVLDRQASQYGYPDGEAMLQAILISMNR